MRDSMIFYRSFYEAIKELTFESQGIIYNAIYEYGLNQNEVELKGIEKTIFTLIKPQLDANLRKFTNGNKGGRPTKNNLKETEIKPKNNLKETKAKANVNDNVNDNDNVNKDTSVSTHPLCLWIKENCINVSKLKNQLTTKQAEKLIEDFTRESIKEVLEAMENYKELTKKYVSVNSTLRNWIKKRQENNPNYGILKTIEATLTKEEALLKKYEGIDIHQVPLDDRLPVHNLRQKHGR